MSLQRHKPADWNEFLDVALDNWTHPLVRDHNDDSSSNLFKVLSMYKIIGLSFIEIVAIYT